MDHWAQVLQVHWGITAQIRRLDGEYDLNFLAEAQNGEGYVIKAMRPDCEDWLVEMQIQALDHLRSSNPDLPSPRVIPASSGAKFLRP